MTSPSCFVRVPPKPKASKKPGQAIAFHGPLDETEQGGQLLARAVFNRALGFGGAFMKQLKQFILQFAKLIA